MADFTEAITYVLANEGGFVDNRDDMGGPTNMGITLDLLVKWRGRPCNKNDMVNLTLAEAKIIYETFFWNPLRLSGLSQPIATALLDTSVNEGQYSAVRLTQMALGQLSPDGKMGPDTLKSLDIADPGRFIKAFIREVVKRYLSIVHNTPSQVTFLNGWMTRALRMLDLIP